LVSSDKILNFGGEMINIKSVNRIESRRPIQCEVRAGFIFIAYCFKSKNIHKKNAEKIK
jgi:hypothetical protein